MSESLFIGEVYPFDFQLLVLDHVVEDDDLVVLYGHQNEAGHDVAVQGRVSSSRCARVHEVLAVILLHAKLVSVPAYQHVAIQLSLHASQGFDISPWGHLVSVNHSYFDVTNFDHLSLWEPLVVIEFTSHCMHLRLR